MKHLKWTIPVSVALIAVTISLGVTPLLASPTTPTLTSPAMSVVPSVSSTSTTGSADFTVYVQVPNNSPVNPPFYDLRPAFVVQSISQGFTEPNGTVILPSTFVTCSSTTSKHAYENYPARGTITICSGTYPQRVDSRAYWGSNTAIYFLGFVGFPATGTWTATFIVTGLYFGNTITLTASTQIKVS